MNTSSTIYTRIQSIALVLILALAVMAQTAQAQAGFGQQWQKADTPLFSIIGMPGSWNGTPIAAYDVIGHVMYDGSGYKSYIGGYDGKTFATGLWTSASIDQGWHAYAGNPVLSGGEEGAWDEFAAGNPMVIFDEGTYRMWYTGYDSNAVYRIGYATSSDGMSWVKYVNNPVLDVSAGGWDSFHLHTPYVIRDGDTYRMWYAGHDETGASWGIGYATSSDGMAWTRASNDAVLVPEESWEFNAVHTPTVLIDQGKFLMWYAGQDADLGTGGQVQTGFASSEDGLTWIKDMANPVLKAGGPNSMDQYVALALGVFKTDATTYKMIYGANSSTFFGGMLATLSIPTSVEAIGGSAAEFSLEQNYPNPFNPQTKIRFSVPATGRVSLKVFNLLGEEVATLVDENTQQGQYEASFTPDGLPSGMYIYRLTAGAFVSSKSMVFLK